MIVLNAELKSMNSIRTYSYMSLLSRSVSAKWKVEAMVLSGQYVNYSESIDVMTSLSNWCEYDGMVVVETRHRGPLGNGDDCGGLRHLGTTVQGYVEVVFENIC